MTAEGEAFLRAAERMGRLIARHKGLKLQLVPVPRLFSPSQREAAVAIIIERPEQRPTDLFQAHRLYALPPCLPRLS
jgi:DNA-binding transcriptional LysR family regulator